MPFLKGRGRVKGLAKGFPAWRAGVVLKAGARQRGVRVNAGRRPPMGPGVDAGEERRIVEDDDACVVSVSD